MFKYLFLALLLCFGNTAYGATVYIDCECSSNGDGSTQTCGGASGVKNAPVTTVSSDTEYSYKAGSSCSLASTAITINQNNVILSSYGTGVLPVIYPGSTSYPLVIGTTTGSTISNIKINGGSSGAININGGMSASTIDGVDINTQKIGFILSNNGAVNSTFKNMDIVCSGAASICTNISSNGGGITFRDSTVTMTATDKSSASLLGIRLNGTASIVDTVTVTGGDMGIEIRTTDGHTVRNSLIQNSATSGIRMRDTSSNLIEGNTIKNVWNGKYYNDGVGAGSNGGTGAGIDLIDISDACGANVVRRNNIHTVFQGIVDQCDSEGGNQYYSNVIRNYLVNGISYQSDGGEGLIAHNTVYHTPYDPVATAGHGIVVQGSSATTKARIINNTVTCNAPGTNVQCINLPLSASTGATYIDNNNYYALNGTAVGALGGTNYTTFSEWRTALQSDADTTGDDSFSLNVNPLFRMGIAPQYNDPNNFRLQYDSPLIGAGTTTIRMTDHGNRLFKQKRAIGAWDFGARDFIRQFNN